MSHSPSHPLGLHYSPGHWKVGVESIDAGMTLGLVLSARSALLGPLRAVYSNVVRETQLRQRGPAKDQSELQSKGPWKAACPWLPVPACPHDVPSNPTILLHRATRAVCF